MAGGFKNTPNQDIVSRTITSDVKVNESLLTTYSSNVTNNTIIDVDIDLAKPKSTDNYFDTTSDLDNIMVNNATVNFTNILQSELTEDQYKAFCLYAEGKTLRELVDENGQLKIDTNEMLDTIAEYNKGKDLKDQISIGIDFWQKVDGMSNLFIGDSFSEELMDAKIQEIVSDESGYDAVVFEKDGDYWIVNTCCDSKEKEDILLIAYSMLYNFTGDDDLYQTLAPLFTEIEDGFSFDGETIEYKDIVNAKDYYEGQVNACYDLIKKYNKTGDGKDIKLGGYSLGGGIMLDAYMRLAYDDPSSCENVNLTLTNPFIGLIETRETYLTDENASKHPGMDTSKKDLNSEIQDVVSKYGNNIQIYCAEGDVVSQFNSVVDSFGDSVIYVKGNPEISPYLNDHGGEESAEPDVEGIISEGGKTIYDDNVFGSFESYFFKSILGGAGEAISASNHSFTNKSDSEESEGANNLNIGELIMGGNSRHGLNGFDMTTFDENGNLTETGTRITLNEIAGGTFESNDIKDLMKDAFKNKLEELRDNLSSYDFGENEYAKDDIIAMYDKIITYIENNVGSLSYDELVDTITPTMTQLLKEAASEKYGILGDAGNLFITEEKVSENLKEYFKTENGQQKLEDILSYLLAGDSNNAVNSSVGILTDIYKETALENAGDIFSHIPFMPTGQL